MNPAPPATSVREVLIGFGRRPGSALERALRPGRADYRRRRRQPGESARGAQRRHPSGPRWSARPQRRARTGGFVELTIHLLRSTLDAAEDGWWSQSFGPRVDGECQRSVTITQVPPDDQFGDPEGDVIKVGVNDASHWVEADRGAEWLFLWAFRQNLIVEACCDDAARAELSNVALQSLEGMRIDEPRRCRDEESDLDREELDTQLFGYDDRMYTDEGCPVRLDIVAMGTAPDDHHCFPGVSSVSVGTPFGASKQDTPERSYTRDPDDLYGSPNLRKRLELDATLPADAIDTGYRRDGAALWVDPSDDTLIYVVTDDAIEAWPLLREEVFCA